MNTDRTRIEDSRDWKGEAFSFFHLFCLHPCFIRVHPWLRSSWTAAHSPRRLARLSSRTGTGGVGGVRRCGRLDVAAGNGGSSASRGAGGAAAGASGRPILAGGG